MTFLNPNNNSRRGFSLIEVLVAITLASLIVMLSYGFYQMGFGHYGRSRQKSQFNQRLQLMYTLFEQNFFSITPYPLSSFGSFLGEPQAITFFVTYEDSRLSTIRQVAVFFKNNTLIFAYLDPNNPNQIIQEFRLSGLKSAEFSYFDALQQRWVSQWNFEDKNNRYPYLIWFKLRLLEQAKPIELCFEVLHGQVFRS